MQPKAILRIFAYSRFTTENTETTEFYLCFSFLSVRSVNSVVKKKSLPCH